ncbi:MAG: response regulator transcription factor [Epsilonproteobacteria bacterium]|nr:response regulator transcription factor [Campylobacterota bacterium]
MEHQTFVKKMKLYSILYIEDDANVRKYITEFLSRYCKTVYTCQSSEEGLILYKQHQPDILLLDINLPGQSGIEFATTIRKNDEKTRILISTAYTNPEFMLQSIELNLTRYLVKPMTNEDLFAALKKSLNELETNETFDLGEGYLYSKNLTAIIKNREIIPLRRKEAEILEFFIAHEGEVIRYDLLEDTVWSESVMTRDAIRSQIRNIRKKIGSNCFNNITGVGYQLKVPK